jgi:predicted ATPase
LSIRNWRNFREADFPVADRLFIVGPNASGKSNLLDAVRFLRDLASEGGGFQAALSSRGGLSRVRNLAARNFNHGHVSIEVAVGDDKEPRIWEYRLQFAAERRGRHRPILLEETVTERGELRLGRPDGADLEDPERLTQTALEQVNANQSFRELVTFFSEVRYLHLVPQMIRDPERRGVVTDDPFGSDFLLRIARTPVPTRNARLRRINDALKIAVPQLQNLDLQRDEEGLPHLVAAYKHWRPHAARQDERDFSDGTLRLIGLLWALQEGGRQSGPVLLEEPELSLHSAVVRTLPTLLYRASRSRGRQVLVTTHSPQILENEGLGLDEVVFLRPDPEGTQAVLAADLEEVRTEVEALGLSIAEALIPRTAPDRPEQLALVAL